MLLNLTFHVFLYSFLCNSINVSGLWCTSELSLELDAARQMWPHQWLAEDTLPWPAGNTSRNAAWQTIGLCFCKCTYAGSCPAWGPLDTFLKICFSARLSTAWIGSVAQDLTFPFMEIFPFHEVSVSLRSKKLAGPNLQASSQVSDVL